MVAQSLHFQGLIVLLIFLNTINFVRGLQTEYFYYMGEVNAIRALWNAWQETPNLSTNLPGWSNISIEFCQYLVPGSSPVDMPSWQGVQCSYRCGNDTCTEKDNYIVGLSLSNASIVGVLPPNTINNFSDLVSLELTGNPNLSGPLPVNLEQSWMNKLISMITLSTALLQI